VLLSLLPSGFLSFVVLQLGLGQSNQEGSREVSIREFNRNVSSNKFQLMHRLDLWTFWGLKELFVYDTIDLANDMGRSPRKAARWNISSFLVYSAKRLCCPEKKKTQPLARLSSSVNTEYSTFTTNPRTSLYISAGQPSPSAVT
jgi:hypothetical protein